MLRRAGDKNCLAALPAKSLLSARRVTEAVDAYMHETHPVKVLNSLARHRATAHAGVQYAGAKCHRCTFDSSVHRLRVHEQLHLVPLEKNVQSHVKSGCTVPHEHCGKAAATWNSLSTAEAEAAAFIKKTMLH